MTDFVVRPMTADDVPATLDLLADVAAEGRWIATEAPIDRDERTSMWQAVLDGRQHAALFVADASGNIIGQAGVQLAPYDVADLGMWVAAAWRRRGVGRALLEAAVGWARDSGAHKVALQVWPHNEAALALYRKAGFVEEGRLRRHYRRRSGELWDAVVMGLLLG